MQVFNRKVQEKLENINLMAKNNKKVIEDEYLEVENMKEELERTRKSFERQKMKPDTVPLSSPSHSNKSCSSIGSTGKKRLFRISLGSFKKEKNEVA